MLVALQNAHFVLRRAALPLARLYRITKRSPGRSPDGAATRIGCAFRPVRHAFVGDRPTALLDAITAR